MITSKKYSDYEMGFRCTWNTLIFILLIFLFLLPIIIVNYLPLDDYPSHLLSIFIIDKYDSQQYDFNRNFTVDWKILPNMGSEIIISQLSRVFDIQIAGKIYLSMVIAFFILSILYFIRSVDRKKSVLALIAFLFAYNWFFHRGYLNFVGGIPCYFFALGFYLRRESLIHKPCNIMLLALLSLLTYLFHALAWLALMGSLFILLITRFRLKAVLAAALSVLPSLALFIHYQYVAWSQGAQTRGVQFLSPLDNILFFVTHFFINFSKPEIFIYVVPMIVIIILFLVSNTRNRFLQSSLEKRIFWLVLVLIAAFFVFPMQWAAVWPFNTRLLVFALFLAAATIPGEAINKFRNVFAAVILFFSLINLGYVYYEYKTVSDQIRVYNTGIEYVGFNSKILPLTFNTGHNWASHEPLSTVWAYYHIEKGGVGPYLFSLSHGQIVNYLMDKNEYLPAPTLYPAHPEEYDPGLHARHYDYIIMWGDDDDTLEKIKLDFMQIFGNGPLRLFEYNKDNISHFE